MVKPLPQARQAIVVTRQATAGNLYLALVSVGNIAGHEDNLQVQSEETIAQKAAAGVADGVRFGELSLTRRRNSIPSCR